MQFTLREVMTIGSICVSFGGLSVWTYINAKGITALWDKKQDVAVCIPAHTHIEKDLKEIKDDVKTLIRMNGGK